MLNRKRGLLVVILIFLFVFAVFAASADTIVYVAQSGNGEKYHKETCQYVRNGKRAISLGDVVKIGYTPCSRCKPPVLD
jgi:hypothetical protein